MSSTETMAKKRSSRNTSTSQSAPRPQSLTQRGVLLFLSSVLVSACAYLTLILRAVPARELWAVLIFVFLISILHLGTRRHNRVILRRLAPAKQLSRNTIRSLLLFSLLVSVICPWILIFTYPRARDIVAPHLFLMMSQILFEAWGYRAEVSYLVRIVIPLSFVAYRLKLLVTWVATARNNGNKLLDVVTHALGVWNLVFWTVVLVYVLLIKVVPVYLPGRAEKIAARKKKNEGANDGNGENKTRNKKQVEEESSSANVSTNVLANVQKAE